MPLDLGPSIGTTMPVDVGPLGTACARNASENKTPNTLFVHRLEGLVKASLGCEVILGGNTNDVRVSTVDVLLPEKAVFSASHLDDA